MKTHRIAMLLFPGVTVLDFVGPYEVFIRSDHFKVFVVSKDKEILQAEGGLTLCADYTFDNCPAADIIFVPGGRGITPLLTDKTYHQFLQQQAIQASHITAVCTGSLLLAAAGLLKDYKATTHWRSIKLLRLMGVEAIEERIVIDRNRITGGGITAGIDFGLKLAALLTDDDTAKTIQLLLEYAPQPPFNAGTVTTAEAHIIDKAKKITQSLFDKRLAIINEMNNS